MAKRRRTKADLDNRANQLNPNNWRYHKVRQHHTEDGFDDDYDDCEDEDWEEDEEFEEEEDDGFELPEIPSCYHGWKIAIDKDEEHKYVVTAFLENADGYRMDSFEINGDEIAEDDDIETLVEEEIDDRNDKQEEADDFIKNYRNPMGLDSDWFEAYDPD